MKKSQKHNTSPPEEIPEDEIDLFLHTRNKISFADDRPGSRREPESDEDSILNQREVLPLDYESDLLDEIEQDYEDDIKAWGRKKSTFYSVDEDAQLEEVSECIRLQALQKSSLLPSDYYYPGLLNPESFYAQIPFDKCPTTSSAFKNGKFTESLSGLQLISSSQAYDQSQDSECAEGRNGLGQNKYADSEQDSFSEDETDGEYFSDESLDGFSGTEDEHAALKKERKRKTGQDAEFVYDKYNDIAPGTKRAVSYEILKNRGLLPARTKEQRNPRVKHRKRYEKAIKRIRSFKPIARPCSKGAPYSGERSGIRVDVVKSVKFKR